MTYPALILHTEDDHKVDLELARTLFQLARTYGKENMAMVTLGKELGLRHTDIYRYEGLPALLTKFVAGNDFRDGERVCRLPDVDMCEEV